MPKRSMNPIDAHVGARVRLKRMLMGMSQERLGELLGVTFQQVQKYEKGANRIGASRLYEISRVLEVPVQYFFNDMPESISSGSPGFSEDAAAFDASPIMNSENVNLFKANDAIKSASIRRKVLELMREIASPSDAERI